MPDMCEAVSVIQETAKDHITLSTDCKGVVVTRLKDGKRVVRITEVGPFYPTPDRAPGTAGGPG